MEVEQQAEVIRAAVDFEIARANPAGTAYVRRNDVSACKALSIVYPEQTWG